MSYWGVRLSLIFMCCSAYASKTHIALDGKRPGFADWLWEDLGDYESNASALAIDALVQSFREDPASAIKYLKKIPTLHGLKGVGTGSENRYENTLSALSQLTETQINKTPGLKQELKRIQWPYLQGPFVTTEKKEVSPGETVTIRLKEDPADPELGSNGPSHIILGNIRSGETFILPRVSTDGIESVYSGVLPPQVKNGTYSIRRFNSYILGSDHRAKLRGYNADGEIPGSVKTLEVKHSPGKLPSGDPVVQAITSTRVLKNGKPTFEVSVNFDPTKSALNAEWTQLQSLLVLRDAGGNSLRDFRPTKVEGHKIIYDVPVSAVPDYGFKLNGLAGLINQNAQEMTVVVKDEILEKFRIED